MRYSAAILLLTFMIAAVLAEGPEQGWVPIFNGTDLDGWTPKILHEDFGKDQDELFQVKDGKIVVQYNPLFFAIFGGEFGHLFYKEKLSHYRLRLEYRVMGKQVPRGPAWAIRNSGLVFHCQSPESMAIHQPFPVGIEMQFLGVMERIHALQETSARQARISSSMVN